MWKFRKQYQANTLCGADGTLINAGNISDDKVEKLLKKAPGLKMYFEKNEEAQPDPAEDEKPAAPKKKSTPKK